MVCEVDEVKSVYPSCSNLHGLLGVITWVTNTSPDSWSEGRGFQSRQKWQKNVLPQGYLSCAYSYCICPPPPALPLLQWLVKDPGHVAINACGRLELNTLTPRPKRSRSGLTICCPGIVQEPIRETSSSAIFQETLVHSRLSSLSHCGQILAYSVELVHSSWFSLKNKTKQKVQPANDPSNVALKSLHARKKPAPQLTKVKLFFRPILRSSGSQLYWFMISDCYSFIHSFSFFVVVLFAEGTETTCSYPVQCAA